MSYEEEIDRLAEEIEGLREEALEVIKSVTPKYLGSEASGTNDYRPYKLRVLNFLGANRRWHPEAFDRATEAVRSKPLSDTGLSSIRSALEDLSIELQSSN